jgi:FkbM family methyltransferase
MDKKMTIDEKVGGLMTAWRVHTSTLFYSLLAALPDIDMFLDVGSLDGREAFTVEARFPNVTSVAFEPNPHNIGVIQAEMARRRSRVTLETFAVGNENGITTFYVQTPHPASTTYGVHGNSSILKPPEEPNHTLSTIEVPLRRLDGIDSIPASTKIALWIDVEGAGYFVLEGLAGIADMVQIVHIEVETKTLFEGEKLAPHVMRLMDSYGFELIGSNFDRDLRRLAGDLVFLRKSTLNNTVKTRAILKAWVIEHLALPHLAYRILPSKLYRASRDWLVQNVASR